MLFSKSPVKDISQKIKPPQASIKNLKFERKKDFDSFLTYIKRETKTLDDIKLPKTAEVQRKPFPLLGALLGFGALGCTHHSSRSDGSDCQMQPWFHLSGECHWRHR